MDIYFCDLCGVRVTDADLRAGHGMRDAHDVICSACLELGHHKEWMNRRAKATKPAATSAKPSPLRGDAADRVATLDDDVPPSRVAPKVIAMEPTPSGAMPVLPEDHTSTAKVPTPGQPSEMPLAGAASLFSALGSSPVNANGSPKTDSSSGEDDDDDLLDQADQPQVTTTPEPAASPFADEVSEDPEKAETALVATKGGQGKAATEEVPAIEDDGAPAKPRASGKDKGDARKSTSSRHSKPAPGKGKSARSSSRAKAGPDSSRMILMGSMISLGIIVLIFGGVIAHKKHLFGKPPAPAAIGIDGEEIKTMVQDTMSKAVAALRAQDLAQLQEARTAMENTQSAVDRFEATAKHSGNSDEQIEHFLERIAKWNDCYAMKKNLNEMIFKLQQH
jgi:hypothetical protein